MKPSVRFLVMGYALFGFTQVAANQQQEVVPGEVIVKLKGSSAPGKSKGVLGKLTGEKNLEIKHSWGKMGMYHFSFKSGQSVQDAVAELNADPDVEYAEPNYILHKASTGEILETYSEQQVLDIVQAEGLEALGIDESVQGAWKSSAYVSSSSSSRPVVAVIDTGMDITHQVFTNTDSIWVNDDEVAGNGIDDDGNGYIDDVNGWNFVDNSPTMYDDDGHGTHVAGIILSVDQNIHVPSASLVDAKIQIMPLKFLNGSGSGSTSDAIEAIYYAVTNGAHVLNNSWGGTSYSAALHEAVAHTYNNGRSFIAAAGNAGSNNDSLPMYPANFDVPNVISVAATYDDFSITSFSNYGSSSVDLGAWGYFINSTVPGGSFGDSSGTSMSAPYVAGTAIQMVVEAPGMMGYQVKSIINSETQYQAALSSKLAWEGRLHPTDSIANASSASIETSQPAYEANFSANREIASEVAGGGCGMVTKLASQYNANNGNSVPRGRSGSGSGGSSTFQIQGPRAWYILLLMGVLLAPVLIATHLRSRGGVESRRVHERFKIDSDVRVKVGDKELVGSVSSISLGGVQLNTEELLENGGIVNMTISSPEGQEQIQVEGRIVWSEEKKAYGVAFQDAPLSALDRITDWTKQLKKTG